MASLRAAAPMVITPREGGGEGGREGGREGEVDIREKA